MLSWQVGGELVGRDAELAVLNSVAAKVADGAAGSVVHLAGEPGIGKSRLLEAFAAAVSGRGMRFLLGRATEFEAHAPFAALADALDEPVASAADSGALDEHEAELLSHLLPSLEPHQPLEIERHRLYNVVRQVLARLASPDGLVLAIDDVHWADQATLEVLRYLVRRPPPAPVLLVLSFRPRQLAPELLSALGGESPTRLELGPLSADEAGVLLGSGISQARRRELSARSQGNPLYLLELAKDATPEIGPFHRELAALPDRELVVLRAAAVAGEDADLTLLAAAANLGETETAAALGELVSRDLLRLQPDGRHRHRHPLLRHAVYAGSPPGWRIDAHRRAVEELLRRGASRIAVAEQVSRCARPGDMSDVDHLAAAAGLAVRIAPASAAHWLGIALRLLPGTPEKFAKRVDMLTQRVTALHLAGQLPEAREAVQRALAVVTPEMAGEHGRLVGLAVTVERLLGRYDEARALARAGLDRVPHGEEETRSALVSELVVANVLAGDFRAAQEHAANIGDGRDLGSVVAAANLVLAALAEAGGRIITGEDVARLAEADRLVDGLTDVELGTLVEIPVWLGLANLQADRLDAATRVLSRGLEISGRTGQHHVHTYLKLLLSTCYFGFGELARAAEAAEEALDSALLSGSDQFVLMALLRLANVVAWQGNPDEAEDLLARADRLVEATGGMFGEQVRLNRAHCRYLRGDPDACAAKILEASGDGDFTRLLTAAPVEWLVLLTEADVVRGDTERVAEWVSSAEKITAQLPDGRQRGLAALAGAWQLLPGDPAESARAAVRAAESLAAARDSLSTARALLLAGRALVRSGDLEGARTRFQEAHAAAEHAGARKLAADADTALRRAALGPLSERDKTIVDLVRAGRSNREIAARLHLSVRTVEASLSRIYATLGVRGRAQLSALKQD